MVPAGWRIGHSISLIQRARRVMDESIDRQPIEESHSDHRLIKRIGFVFHRQLLASSSPLCQEQNLFMAIIIVRG